MVMTIDRPDRLNAVDAQMHGQLAEVWPVLDADPSLSVVVIHGRGAHFSAGGDLGMIEAMIAETSTRERVM